MACAPIVVKNLQASKTSNEYRSLTFVTLFYRVWLNLTMVVTRLATEGEGREY